MHNFASVSELNNRAANLISDDDLLSSLSIKGELSGVRIYSKRNRMGQLFYTVYFKLKDTSASVDGIMFLNDINQLGFELQDGIEVVCYGSCSIYAPTGAFRLKASMMSLQGSGDINEQMRKLYKKLNEEGLFAEEHKQSIPLLPKRIGVITSIIGDVIHDIISTLDERNTHYDILIYPAAVSGSDCPRQIIEGIKYFSYQNNVDVIIIARGGGAPEEFVGFNTEELARAIYDCPIPVISAVGHEPDYTICDYVSDLRVPTPTGAGRVVLGGYNELSNDLRNKKNLLALSIDSYIEKKQNQLNSLRHHKALQSPTYYVAEQRNHLQRLMSQLIYNGTNYVATSKSELDNYRNQLVHSMELFKERERYKLSGYIDNLELLGPTNVLKRGYSYITKDDRTVMRTSDISQGDNINIVLSDGSIEASVVSVNREV